MLRSYGSLVTKLFQRSSSQKVSPWVLAGALVAGFLGSTNSYGITTTVYGKTFTDSSLPSSIMDPGSPAFATRIHANYSGGLFQPHTLTVSAANPNSLFLVSSSPSSYGITDTTFNLTANFSRFGVFTSGMMSIGGKINGSAVSETLMSATLDSFSRNLFGTMWGFNTSNIFCSASVESLGGQCTQNESVYLAFNKGRGTFFPWWFGGTGGVALTTVPVPAAAWLFGTGLVGLMGIARRRKTA